MTELAGRQRSDQFYIDKFYIDKFYRDRHEFGNHQIGDPFVITVDAYSEDGKPKGTKDVLHVLSNIYWDEPPYANAEPGQSEGYMAPCGAGSQSWSMQGIRAARHGRPKQLRKSADEVCDDCFPNGDEEAEELRAEAAEVAAFLAKVAALAIERLENPGVITLGMAKELYPNRWWDQERLDELGQEYFLLRLYEMETATTIEEKIKADPETELTEEEIRFLYEVDHDIRRLGEQWGGLEDDPSVRSIRWMRGDRDKAELSRILPETIREQLGSAFAAYEIVATQLEDMQGQTYDGEARLSFSELENILEAKDKEWRANGLYDYLAEYIIRYGGRFTLVKPPSVEANEAQIVALAENFGKDQPHETHVDDDLYREGRYTGHELSGNSGDDPAGFCLIPSRREEDMRDKRDSVEILHERQASRPELQLRVPSMLVAITYWHTLRVQGGGEIDEHRYERAEIVHFDREPTRLIRSMVVPSSYVSGGGASLSSRSGTSGSSQVRLAVG